MQFLRNLFFTNPTTFFYFFKNLYSVNLKLKLLSLAYYATLLVFLSILFITFSTYTQVALLRYLAIWLAVGLSFYWVLSAIWCLYDKDDYGRNVSASDDFYNVAFTSFWLIEGFLLGLFLSYARLFDFYDPFLESDEIENTFINEDIDGGNLKLLITCFIVSLITTTAIDLFTSLESVNFFWLIVNTSIIFFVTLLSFARISVRFIEEFDFEEDGDFLFDENDQIFEHEDFPEEGFDGGDYAEGYEILQLFFGYWHYTFILIHLAYITYALLSANGRQQHVYWAVAAISQNVVLLLVLDFLDWGEVFSLFELITFDTIYPWFYSSEDTISGLSSIFDELLQVLLFFVNM